MSTAPLSRHHMELFFKVKKQYESHRHKVQKGGRGLCGTKYGKRDIDKLIQTQTQACRQADRQAEIQAEREIEAVGINYDQE